ncbi:MAG TPA: Ku protein [Gemmatimonadales bacterium]|jgi:DNA end-binding protein Ku
MSARPIGSATISFGLVSVPVKLYSSAESAATVSFNLLHKACGTRLKQQYVCPKDGVIVEKDDMAKGYEFAKGQYVLFSPEELKALEEKATNSIDIAEFVPLSEVERIYLEKVYYLGPDKGGDRAYRLLGKALEETGRAALGQYAARGQQHLVLVRPMNGVLVMEQLHYADEIRPASEVPLGDGEVKAPELTLAKQLIEQSATDEFRPQAYSDQVRTRVLESIQKKVDGQEITAEPAEETGAKIIDLMEALKASLAKGGKAPDAGRAPAKRAPAKAEAAEKTERAAKPAKRAAGGRR